MTGMLRAAYEQPARGGVFYSANGTPTGSARLNAMERWDWTPVPSRSAPGGSTCMFPLGLGCRPTRTSEGTLWIEKLITDPAQVKDIGIPDIYDGAPGDILRQMADMSRSLPHGELVRCPDVQSPLGVAELMWDESFYMALIDTPDAVHELCDKITSYIIAFVKEFNRLCGPRLNPCGFPLVWADGPGTMIADDTMTLVSPAMHEEFSLPYVNRIADECGPLYYHSCTWRKPYYANIHKIRNVRAYNWNPGNSDDFAVLVREFGGKAMITPHLVCDMHKDNDVLALGRNFADEFEFFRYMVESIPDNAAVYFWFSNVLQKGQVMERIHDYLHGRGLSPAAKRCTSA